MAKLTKKNLIKLTAEQCDYHKYEVEDVINALITVMQQQLEQGNEIEFPRLFKFHLQRPKQRFIYKPHDQTVYMSPSHPRIVFKTSDTYKNYLETEFKGEVHDDRRQPV